MPKPAADDWRRQGQDRFLTNQVFRWRSYRAPNAHWDHDHCEFCWATFMEKPADEALTSGYCTADGERWVCKQCFDDFREEMGFTVNQGPIIGSGE